MIEVSVIIPVYNVEKYVEKCIVSVFNQTIKDNIEFIIVDDASPDDSIGIIKSVLNRFPYRADQIKIITHEENKGLASSRNTGMSHAKGKYIIHLDSDDWIEENMIEGMLNRAKETNADIVTCDFYGVYKRKEIYFGQDIPENSIEYFVKMLNANAHYAPWNKLIKSSLYKKLDHLWLDGVNMWEDVATMPRLVYFANYISHIPKPYYHYNQNNVNSYSKLFSEKTLQNIKAATDEIVDFVENQGAKDKFAHDLKMLKGHAKFTILAHCPPNLIRKYSSIYSDFGLSDIKDSKFKLQKKLIFALLLSSRVKLGQNLFKSIEKFKNLIR